MTDHSIAGTLPAEQRTLERLPLHLNVMLIARGMSGRSCWMKDISPGGALLELVATQGHVMREVQSGEVVLIRVFLRADGTAREHELRARVTHADSPHFGVSFSSPDPATLALLLAAARDEQVAHSGVMSPESVALVEQLGQQVLASCHEPFGVFFQVADEYLLAAAEQAHSNVEQRQLCEAATLLRNRRDEVLARYLAALKQSFQHLGEGWDPLESTCRHASLSIL